MMRPNKDVAAVEWRAGSILGALREGSSRFSGALSIPNGEGAVDDAYHGVREGQSEALPTDLGTKVAWVRRSVEVTSILAAITLSIIGLVKIVDTLLDAVHH